MVIVQQVAESGHSFLDGDVINLELPIGECLESVGALFLGLGVNVAEGHLVVVLLVAHVFFLEVTAATLVDKLEVLRQSQAQVFFDVQPFQKVDIAIITAGVILRVLELTDRPKLAPRVLGRLPRELGGVAQRGERHQSHLRQLPPERVHELAERVEIVPR